MTLHYRLRVDVFDDGMWQHSADQPLTEEDAKFLDELVKEGAGADLSEAAAWALNEQRLAWQGVGDQDGPESHLPSDVVN